MREGELKVKRQTPVLMSVPTVPMRIPTATIPIPLIADPMVIAAAATRPSSMIAKYSAGPKESATLTSKGAKKVRRRMPMMAATKDAKEIGRARCRERGGQNGKRWGGD